MTIRRHYESVVISPHLDDAVFSCSGLLAASPHRALVINVCSLPPAEEVGKTRLQISTQRAAEERHAAALLAFDSVGLDEQDAPLRQRAYQAPSRLFLRPVPEDHGFSARIASKLAQVLAGIEYDVLYAPLGIGWHVDHVQTHRAVNLLESDRPVRFYEDAPYCMLPHATATRLLELGADGWQDELDLVVAAGANARWYEMGLAFCGMAPVRQMRPAIARPFAKLVMLGYFARLCRAHPPAVAGLDRTRMRPVYQRIDTDFDRKIDACCCYVSQVAEFFLDRQDCASRFRQYAAGIAPDGGLYERYWTIAPR